MQPTRKTQPHRRGKPMVQGPSLAAMLQGAGSMGNPQDAVREATKQAFKRGALKGAVNGGIPDGGDPQLAPPGLPPHSGASGILPQMLAAVPMARNAPGGGGQGVGGEQNNVWPDANPNGRRKLRPRRDRRGDGFYHRGPYRGLPPFDGYPRRIV